MSFWFIFSSSRARVRRKEGKLTNEVFLLDAEHVWIVTFQFASSSYVGIQYKDYECHEDEETTSVLLTQLQDMTSHTTGGSGGFPTMHMDISFAMSLSILVI
mmetsp:Transcript_13812/g.18368  ORF Transcript_13812/g.18368 Transcript_13812/m.18368 type:complete len:102 (+) Transcript_13812:1053-1358(+)